MMQIQSVRKREPEKARGGIQFLKPSKASIHVRRRMNQYVLHTIWTHARKAAAVQGNTYAQFLAAISSPPNRNTSEIGILPVMYHRIQRRGLYNLWIMTLMQQHPWKPPGWERLVFIALSFVVGQATWHLQWSIFSQTASELIIKLGKLKLTKWWKPYCQ